MIIRPVRNGEIIDLFDIHRAVFSSHIEQIWGWDEDWQKDNFKREAESAETSVVIIDGVIIGYVQICDNENGLYLQNIAILPEYQRKGVGTRLIQRFQALAVAKEAPLQLSVFRTNTSALRFYERLGFEKAGDTNTHYQMVWKSN